MFDVLEGTLDHALDARRGARRRRLREIREQTAQLAQEVTQIVRDAEDEDDWRAAGCTSSAQWLAQIYDADYRAAERITRTSDALRALPALDEAMSNGELSLDQALAVVEVGDAGDRGRADAHRGRQSTRCDRACRAPARAAGAG